jgi:hypothetical protein
MNTAFKPFALGQIVATPSILKAVPPERLWECLARHARGDYGDVCPEDAELNNQATHEGTRILSAYAIDPTKPCKGYGENCLWIITEADRSSTCILEPESY